MDSKELEKNVISAVLANNELADELIEKTNIEYFTQPKLKEIRKWISKKKANNEEISVVRLATELDVDPDIVSDKNLFHEFDDSVDLLHKNYIKRLLKSKSKEIYNLTKNNDLTIDELLHQSQELIFQATSEIDNEETQYLLGDALMKSFDSFHKRLAGQGEQKVKTGMYQIDNRWGGLRRKHLIVLGANSSVGKTAFAIKILRNVLFNGGKCAIASLEMDAEEITDRLVISESCVPGRYYDQAQKMSERQIKSVNNAFNILDKYEDNLFISEKRNMTTEDIAAVIRKADNNMGQLDLVVVDYLQNVKYDHSKNFVREIGEICRDLRSLSLQINVPIILVSQLTRSNQKEKKRPTMADMRGGGEIEETADEIWFLHRPDYLEEKSPQNMNTSQGDRVIGELIQEKGRTTGTGICEMYFYKDIVRWEDSYEFKELGKREPSILRK